LFKITLSTTGRLATWGKRRLVAQMRSTQRWKAIAAGDQAAKSTLRKQMCGKCHFGRPATL